ncbi:MAG: energy-coupling factor transporter transmembrane protein EcfT [Clostridia bacterium]|nr:energy-coupling factor transporter transmembrane protein EcfT [Clostridia bacterium]
MFKDGIGEDSRFKQAHPLVNLIFYGFVIGVLMFSMDPYILALALIFAWAYSALLKGRKVHRTNLFFALPVLLFTVVVNTFFTHNGQTVLFFIHNNRITLEAFVFGIATAALFTGIIVWFVSFNEIMSSDKLIYMFGKIAPVLGLTLSMIFRFIPLLKERFKEIRMGQQCMGRSNEGKLMHRIRQLTKEISILISWSLEASIETSDSMEARGYGLPHRTSFHLFKLSAEDKTLLAAICFFGVLASVGCVLGYTNIEYYPKVTMPEFSMIRLLTLMCYSALMLIPIVLDILGEKRWQRLMSKI